MVYLIHHQLVRVHDVHKYMQPACIICACWLVAGRGKVVRWSTPAACSAAPARPATPTGFQCISYLCKFSTQVISSS